MSNTTLSEVANHHFDYIVAGGGTAGLTLAASLSSDPSVTVLVLEAGSPNLDDPNILILGQFGRTFGNPKYDWDYKTTPQKYSDGTVINWRRGKGLGGSSALNFYAWSPRVARVPPKEDINIFEKLGNPGWNWEDYHSYIKRGTTFTGAPIPQAVIPFVKSYHGIDGPLQTSSPAGMCATLELPFQKAMESLGIPILEDGYGGNVTGVHIAPLTMDPKTFTRSYSANVFYTPNKDRPNFKVLTNAHVTTLVFASDSSPEGLVVASVEFIHESSSNNHIVHASCEVILSTGTIVSPQILELSGIGRRDVLDGIGVAVKIELDGVGENVQDHEHLAVNWELDGSVTHETWDNMFSLAFAAEQLRLREEGKGMNCHGIISYALLSFGMMNPEAEATFLKNAEQNVKKQNFEAENLPGLTEQLGLQLELLKDKHAPEMEMICFPGYFSAIGAPKPGKQYLSLLVFLMHSFSRGSIHTKSNNPLEDPVIDPRVFSNNSDLELLVESVKFARKVANMEAFKDVVRDEYEPGKDCASDEQIQGYIKKALSSTWHAVGSCSMLPKEKNGVVDPKLKVYGTKNLRIADLSIIPIDVAAHTQGEYQHGSNLTDISGAVAVIATAYVIGMKAADIIREAYRP